jgi:hypothetical protein
MSNKGLLISSVAVSLIIAPLVIASQISTPGTSVGAPTNDRACSAPTLEATTNEAFELMKQNLIALKDVLHSEMSYTSPNALRVCFKAGPALVSTRNFVVGSGLTATDSNVKDANRQALRALLQVAAFCGEPMGDSAVKELLAQAELEAPIAAGSIDDVFQIVNSIKPERLR